VMALARVEVPGVLAIQRDHDQEVTAVALSPPDAPKSSHEVAHRIACVHAVIVEPDQIAEQAVPEDRRHLPTPPLQAPRSVDELGALQCALVVPVEVDVDRTAKDRLV